jgi:putative PIN family toxin of toxin-antitoxin system
VLTSFATLAELREVLAKKRFRRYFDEEDIRIFIAALTREAEWIDVTVEIRACRDPKDDMFLELAASGHADYIVSGDADLIALNPFQGTHILPPHSFLQLLFPEAPR